MTDGRCNLELRTGSHWVAHPVSVPQGCLMTICTWGHPLRAYAQKMKFQWRRKGRNRACLFANCALHMIRTFSFVLLLAAAIAHGAAALTKDFPPGWNHLAQKPPLGWRSWNAYHARRD